MSYKWKVLVITLLGMFPEMMNTTISSIALPHILADFNETIDKLQLITSVYLLGMAVSSALAAYLIGKFGLKKIWILAQVFFLIGSLLCGISWNANSLIIFRFIQGLSAGALMPIAMTLIFTTVPREEQGQAMGILGIPMILAPTIGLTLGGYLVEYFSWRWGFYISIPIVIISLAATMAWLKDTEKQPALPLDFKSFIFVSLGFGLILYALTYASTWGWSDVRTLALIGIGLICLIIWIFVGLRIKIPLLDVRVFKSPSYSMGTLLTFIITVGMYSAMLLLPLYLQSVRGLGAFQSGLIMLPLALSALIGSLLGGRLYDNYGPRIPTIIGFIIMGLAAWQLSSLDANTSTQFLIIMLLIFGIGTGFAMMPIITYTLSGVPQKLTAEASSINNVLRSVFGSLGTAIFATLLSNAQKMNMEVLTQTATPDSGATLGILSTAQVYLQQAGMSLQAAHQTAIYMLYQQTALKAYILAFDKVFIIGAIILFAGIIPALFLHRRAKTKEEKKPDIHLL